MIVCESAFRAVGMNNRGGYFLLNFASTYKPIMANVNLEITQSSGSYTSRLNFYKNRLLVKKGLTSEGKAPKKIVQL